jgi:peptidoglycan/xylan/chitin deacetylase (PgdA/CDA1 family)
VSRLTILMYHIIDRPRSATEAKYCCPPELFERQMRYLADSGRAMPLAAIADAVRAKGACPRDAVAVTFDDGFRATHEAALPILTKFKVPATMFVVSAKIGGSNDWMSTRNFPHRELMSRHEILAMRDAGIGIGSHTRSHPRLPELTAAQLDDEIAGSKADLEQLLGQPIEHFAYPFGLFNEAARAAVEAAGYKAAVSVRSGFNGATVNPFELRRIEVYAGDTEWRFRQKLAYGTNEASLALPLKYYAGRLRARLAA